MSTFDGKVVEFPDIRIDYFRPSPGESHPALAYFLSHVHSDHLIGLESCKSPFIYCSPATRDILLRLEKYPHRMNFNKGILETRKQTYRHLKNLLKALPLETPTVIELCPGNEIRVTLFDANHCVGAVMFLIEGDGKAVLYTGDIRSELWWVNSLARHPVLLPYVMSPDAPPQKRLDCIYLDTTFVVTGREEPYAVFPSKAAGLRELLQKVDQYPADTKFYLDAWTFGYEDVWQALSVHLKTQIHVDDYRYGVYRSLVNGIEPKAPEAVKLLGFYCGNHFQQACLSSSTDRCRIHSCEQGTGCEIWNHEFVRVTPIVTRYNNTVIAELGAGGGQGDLNQQHELEVGDAELVGKLMALCASKLQGQGQLLSGVLRLLTSYINNPEKCLKLEDFNLTTHGDAPGDQDEKAAESDDIPLEKLVTALSRIVAKAKCNQNRKSPSIERLNTFQQKLRADGLPKQITFPYSRHSSYLELCYLVEAFKPTELYPCTVDEANWESPSSMISLFGHLYNEPKSFCHDMKMFKRKRIEHHVERSQSRPGSSKSSSSEYCTSQANAPVSKGKDTAHETANQAGTSEGRLKSAGNGNRRRASVANTTSTRSRKARQAQADFWPPAEPVDHYSPPKKRSSSRSIYRNSEIDVDGTDHLKTTSIGNVYDQRITRPNETLEDRFPGDTAEDHFPISKKRGRSDDIPEYGRLSPPPGFDGTSKPEGHEDGTIEASPSHLRPHPARAELMSMSASSHFSPSGEKRYAHRRSIQESFAKPKGTSWSGVELVSTNGHQEEEMEL